MKNWLLGFIYIFLVAGCATNKVSYNQQEFETKNYQVNMKNAVDAADLLKDFDKSNIPNANLSTDDFSQLVQADLYFNQGDYTKAYSIFKNISFKYKDPRIIYKAIICLEHIKISNSEAKELNALLNLFIKTDPESNLTKLFEIHLALDSDNPKKAEQSLDYLIKKNPENARAILLFLSSIISNDAGIDISNAKSQSLAEFADYVVKNYYAYPEANLIAVVSYAVTNREVKLISQLSYINKNYPTWDIPLYWATGILARSHNDALIRILEEELFKEHRRGYLLQNIYIAALLSFNQEEKAKNYLISQLDSDVKNNTVLNLGIIYARNGQYTEALNYLIQHKEIDEVLQSVINMVIGVIYDYTENQTNAIKYYKLVIPVNPYLSQIANEMLLNAYLQQKNYSAINSFFDNMAATNNLDEKQSILLKVSFYIGAEEYKIAYNILEASFDKYKTDKEYLYQSASMSAYLKKTQQAISLYKKYIKLDPKEPFGYNDLAFVLAEQTTNYKLAKSYIDKAMVLEPLDSNIQDTYGYIQYKLGNSNEAFIYVKNAYNTLPSPESAKHLQEIYIAMHRADLAKEVIIIDKKSRQKQAKVQLIKKTLGMLMYMQYGVEFK